jgi:sRNA-binding protein
MEDLVNAQVGEPLGNLHLDEVTGEKVSKSELKKRQKHRDTEKKKREKAAAAPPKAEKKVSAEEEESNLTPNVCKVASGCFTCLTLSPSNTTRSVAVKYRNFDRARIPTPTLTSFK